MKEHSFWSDTVAAFSPAPHELPPRVDVAIVGGGYTGLSAARELARRGARVAVLEANTIGWGASSRNGGMVLTGLKAGVGKLVKQFGVETARALFCTSLDAINYVEQVVGEESIACDFRRFGHIELAYKPGHFTGFIHEAELLQKHFQHPVRLVDKAHLSDEIESELYHGGLIDEASAGVNPAQYAAGLARAAERAGAWLFAHTRVVHIERGAANGQGFNVATSRGKLRADQVMIATNGYTERLVPWLQRRIIPIGSYIIATEPLPPELAQRVNPRRRMMFDSKNFLYYFRLSADNRMIFGGRAGFVPPNADTLRRSAAILQRGMLEVYPQLKGITVEYAWGGTLGFTFDLLPHAGTTPDGVHYALGCGGHGVALLSYLGACVARRIAGERVENPLFNLPFPTAPANLYNGNPWFLPLAGLYYRLLDAIS
ncbi:MAG: FAD-binding oxidoreductase [Anaerolineae bacterium]|nr:FAD-binding oxidoreductase [Candidatus Roseilinea sp.]MDW8451302.1 FAD-binding oxidoreductase [Anaerolineae bacterium]